MIGESVRLLREAVNRRDVKDRLKQDLPRWKQLCSSMDAIGDTDFAVAAFLQWPPTEDTGQLYLLTYGLLQVLYVQQDAVRHAAEAVGLKWEDSEALKNVRDVRNKAIGHPTKRDRGPWKDKPESFGIVQHSMSHETFELYSSHWNELPRTVRLRDLIEAHGTALTRVLGGIIRHLDGQAG